MNNLEPGCLVLCLFTWKQNSKNIFAFSRKNKTLGAFLLKPVSSVAALFFMTEPPNILLFQSSKHFINLNIRKCIDYCLQFSGDPISQSRKDPEKLRWTEKLDEQNQKLDWYWYLVQKELWSPSISGWCLKQDNCWKAIINLR